MVKKIHPFFSYDWLPFRPLFSYEGMWARGQNTEVIWTKNTTPPLWEMMAE